MKQLRFVMIAVTLVAAASLLLAKRYPGTVGSPSGWTVAAFWSGLALALGAAIESIWGLQRIRDRRRREGRELELDKALVSVLVEVAKLTGVDVDIPGANIWTVYTPRAETPSLYREWHRRLSSHPQMSDRAWTKGKGVIGRCWEKEAEVFHDWTPLRSRFADVDRISKTVWKNLTKADRWGFTRDEYLDMIRKYQQIVAVPIKDSQGRLLGCLSVDIPADRPASNPNCLNTQEVRLVLATAADGLRPLIT